MRVRIAQYVLAILAGISSGCSVVPRHGIQSVSIAPDDRSFVVAYQKGRESVLAISGVDDGTSTVVLRSRDGTKYERPIFSENGLKLYFISRTKKDKAHLSVVNVDGSGLTQLTFGQEGAQDIRDIALSKDGSRIYYINSDFYGNYSPIASAQPHNLDFFSISKDGTDLKRLSFTSSYALNGLALSPDGKEIYSRFAIFSLEEPGEARPFVIKNPPFLTFTTRYPLSEISGSEVVLACSKIEERRPGYNSKEKIELQEFSAVYGSGLFLIDIDAEAVVDEIVYLAADVTSPARTRDGQRILFIRNDSVWGGEGGRTLWIVNMDGSNLREIELGLMEDP